MRLLFQTVLCLFLQLLFVRVMGGGFCDFLTPMCLYLTVTMDRRPAMVMAAVLGVLSSALAPQPLPVLLAGFLLAEAALQRSFIGEWRHRPAMVFWAGLFFSLVWQGLGLVYAGIFSQPLESPLFFLSFFCSMLTAGLLSAMLFCLLSWKADRRGERW